MASVSVSPAEQRKFAAYLRDHTAMLMSRKQRFMEMIDAARTLCRDERYAKFRQNVADTAKALEDFKKLADRYEDYLLRKAVAGERYLRG